MTSPICTVNNLATHPTGVSISPGGTATIRLYDSTGVSSWSILCSSSDGGPGLNVPPATINASLVQTGFQATFTVPSEVTGCALQFTSVVNNGQDVNGSPVEAYTDKFGIFAVGADGYRLVFPGQTTEGNETYGWTPDINFILRTGDGVPAATGSSFGTIILAGDLTPPASGPLVRSMTGVTTGAASGVIRLANNTSIKARNAANSQDLVLVESDASDNVRIGSDANTASVVLGDNSPVIKIGTGTVASAGTTRYPSASSLTSRNNGNTADITMMSTDASDNLTLGDSINTAIVTLNAKSGSTVLSKIAGTTVLTVAGALVTSAQPLAIGATVASTGQIRLPNNVNVSARNAANSQDLPLVGIDGSNVITLGSTTNQDNTVLAAPSAKKIIVAGTGGLQWNTGVDILINQADLVTNSGSANTLTIQAQNETGTTSTGGNLIITSGTGTSLNGDLTLKYGGTQRVFVTSAGNTIGTTTTIDTLTGGRKETNITITGNRTIDTTTKDLIVLINVASGGATVTLPAHATGRRLEFIDIAGTISPTNQLTFARSGGTGKIGGVAASKVYSSAFFAVTMVDDGADWQLS